MTQNLRKVIFPLGGRGTRMLPATKVIPKELLPVLDKPLIQYAIDEALASGAEHLIFVTGDCGSLLKDYVEKDEELNETLRKNGKTEQLAAIENIVPKGIEVSFVTQSNPLGLGHAVWCARDFINDDEFFAVMLPDDLVIGRVPCLQQMVESYQPSSMEAMIAVVEILDAQIEKYGVLETTRESGQCVFATGIVEKPQHDQSPSRYAAIGRYILQPNVMKALNTQTKGTGGEIQLTDAIANVIRGESLCGYLFEGTRYDCGSKLGLLQANLEMASRHKDFKDLVGRCFVPGAAA